MKSPVQQLHEKARGVTVEKILRYVEPVQPDTEIERLFEAFSDNKNLRSIAVVSNECPVGLVNRYEAVDCLSLPYHRQVIDKNPCADMMDSQPLLIDKSAPIHELIQLLSESDSPRVTDDFIITDQGRYAGLGNVQDLLREITNVRIEAAHAVNPSSVLPVNTPINEHIENLLQSGKSFVVCYADLDHFKAFNDVYGYRKGDEVIKFIGELLGNVCDPAIDFIGHVVGDNFIILLQSKDWEKRCNQALTDFAQTSTTLFDKEHRAIGGYLTEDRQGRIVHHPLPTLSMGVVCVTPQLFGSHYEVTEAALAAKELAKKKPGNSLFIERRRVPLQNGMKTSGPGMDAHYG